MDAILVWRLDRWGRSVADQVNSLAELETAGVAKRDADVQALHTQGISQVIKSIKILI